MKENQTITQFLCITKSPYSINNEQGKVIYFEDSKGYWIKRQYDVNGNEIYSEDSDGYWVKREYNANGKEIYSEDSKGDSWKREYNTNGNTIRFEISNGFWLKKEYDANGKEIYFENSHGYIKDNRPKQVELTLAEIATKLNIPLEQLRIKE